LVHGYHLIFSTYGFWLPNDPRGSWSTFVGSWELWRFGDVNKVETRRSVAAESHDRYVREAAKEALAHPALSLTGRQALSVGNGFEQAVRENAYIVHACSILPEHAHLVLARLTQDVSRVIGHLKGRATHRLIEDGLWPDRRRPVWGKKGWKVFLSSAEDMRRAIAYVEANPEREGKPRQRWAFVTPYSPR
jgi:REP element-mobilizing transposase RayT